MSLSFPSRPSTFNFDRGAVCFAADSGGKAVQCCVSEEALQDHCGATGGVTEDLIAAYERCSAQVQTVASAKYDRGETEFDGSILVRTADL